MKPVLVGLALSLVSCAIHGSRSEPPHVSLTLSATHSTCADPPRAHYEFGGKQHRHVVVYATAYGDVQPDDVMIVTVSDRATRFRASHGTVAVDFPAGVGDHKITAEWTDAAGTVRHSAETALRVFEWALCEPAAQGM